MEFRKVFETVCKSFGGDIEEEEGTLACVFGEDEPEEFEAFAVWLYKNAVKNKMLGEYLAKWTGFVGNGDKVKEEFYVRNGEGHLEYEILKSLGSFESLNDWAEELLEERGINGEVIDTLDLDAAYRNAENAVDNINYKEAISAPPYIFMMGGVRCEAEEDYTYDTVNLVCVGELNVGRGGVITAMLNDLENAVDNAMDVAEQEWNSAFEESVVNLAKETM